MSAHPHASAPPNPGIIFDMANAYQQTAALKAAIDLDIFRAIGKGPGDLASIAAHVSGSERGTRILCDFLVINGILNKQDGRYVHTPTSAVFLDPASPACVASVAGFICAPDLLSANNELAGIVRSGRTSLPGEGTVEADNPLWVTFARSMAPLMAPIAPVLAGIVLDDLTGPLRVLDIAAGHGLFGIAIARQNPEAHITALDWAPVLDVALDNARKANIADRYTLLPGSAFDLDFQGPYDAILLTNFLHHFDPPTCTALLRKVHAALRPGGIVATLEFVPNDDRVSPPVAAAFALNMLTSTIAGDAYTLRELSSMYTDASFTDIASHPLPMNPHTVLLGRA